MQGKDLQMSETYDSIKKAEQIILPAQLLLVKKNQKTQNTAFELTGVHSFYETELA